MGHQFAHNPCLIKPYKCTCNNIRQDGATLVDVCRLYGELRVGTAKHKCAHPSPENAACVPPLQGGILRCVLHAFAAQKTQPLVASTQVFSIRFWMYHYMHSCPKRTVLYSNRKEVVAFCRGKLARRAMKCRAPTPTVRKYKDAEGRSRYTGIKKALKDSQIPASTPASCVA